VYKPGLREKARPIREEKKQLNQYLGKSCRGKKEGLVTFVPKENSPRGKQAKTGWRYPCPAGLNPGGLKEKLFPQKRGGPFRDKPITPAGEKNQISSLRGGPHQREGGKKGAKGFWGGEFPAGASSFSPGGRADRKVNF